MIKMAPLKVCAITTKYLLIGNSVGEHWGVGLEQNWGHSEGSYGDNLDNSASATNIFQASSLANRNCRSLLLAESCRHSVTSWMKDFLNTWEEKE